MIFMSENVKQVVETGAPIVAVGTFAGWLAGVLPSVAAFMSILWLLAQLLMHWEKIYDSALSLWKRIRGGSN